MHQWKEQKKITELSRLMNTGDPDLILVDAHVHYHRCFDPVTFVEAACANFKDAVQGLYGARRFIGLLLLAEGPLENGFDRLLGLLEKQNITGDVGLEGWRLQRTQESTSMDLTFRDERALIVIAGRQVHCQENLEVLAIGTRQQFEEGHPVEEVIREVAQAGALPIVPWGFGKWVGRRRRRLQQLLQDPQLPPFFVGDNANRPAFWPRPSLFRLAEERGIPDLPGSDPLPFPAECRRPGCSGFILRDFLDRTEPAGDLKKKLLDRPCSLQPFGKGEQPVRFIRNQLAMQYRKLTERGNRLVQ